MISYRACVRTGCAALFAAAVTLPTASFAVPRYDGLWSVSIVTTKGDCIASYRYPMRISNGVLANGGDVVIDVHGKVAPTGTIKVLVSHGDSHATGLGKLAANSGRGTWTGGSCAGLWTAERRSL
jgi:hypothetical protein